jgi:N-acetylmuramoyl-L-alanine amidase
VWAGRAAAAALICLAPLAAGADGDVADRFDAVVVDAGHGGEDEGARGPRGSLEKDVALDVASRLASGLRRAGLRVVMTRTDDRFVALEQRTSIANDSGGDLFVSIHANAAPDPRIRGSETFFLSLDASDESAQRVAERENRAFGADVSLSVRGDDPMPAIFRSLMSDERLRESQEFARLAQERLAALRPRGARGVKQAPFVVLHGVQMPASLVEIGFITNADDEKWLSDPKGRQQLSDALAQTVLEFGRRYDAVRGIAPLPARALP